MAVKKEEAQEFLIVNRRTGMALQANGEENGFAVVQGEINDTPAQLWRTEEAQDGVKLVNKLAGKLLDVTTGGTENGLTAQVWEDVNGDSQVWKLSGRKYKKILNTASGKVLDIAGIREESGAQAQIWEDIGGENQQWELRKLTEEKPRAATVKKSSAKKPVRKPVPAKKPMAKTRAAEKPVTALPEKAEKKPVTKK